MTRYVGIDPSTKTGFVILDEDGKVILQEEIKPTSTRDPQRFIEISTKMISELDQSDIICIEGFSYGSRGAGVSFQYGLGWTIRTNLYLNGYLYHEVSPGAVKKFATGKGNSNKDAMVLPIFKRWNFENDSDNVRDAFVLSQIARALDHKGQLTRYQEDVLKKVGK